MADPLNILIRSILTKLFQLEEGEVDLDNGRVLQCIDFLSRSTALEEAWQQPCFHEFLLVENAACGRSKRFCWKKPFDSAAPANSARRTINVEKGD